MLSPLYQLQSYFTVLEKRSHGRRVSSSSESTAFIRKTNFCSLPFICRRRRGRPPFSALHFFECSSAQFSSAQLVPLRRIESLSAQAANSHADVHLKTSTTYILCCPTISSGEHRPRLLHFCCVPGPAFGFFATGTSASTSSLIS